MHRYDIVAVGECLVDFICTVRNGKLYMEGNPGGAPLNVMGMASKLGMATAVVGKVGKDKFGDFLLSHIRTAKIDTSYVLRSEAPTTIAIVQLDSKGDRSFTFYRDQTADVLLNADELPAEAFTDTRIVHFGSVSMTQEPARSATLEAVKEAKKAGALVSFDPNLRPLLWNDLNEARRWIFKGLRLADFVKVSDEELRFVTEEKDINLGIEKLFASCPMQILVVTLGPGGCICKTENGIHESHTFDTLCVDTTGAGDAFWGAALSWILRHGAPQSYDAKQIEQFMDFANAAGSLTTTRKGALSAMPDQEQIENCIMTVPRLDV